MTDVNPMEKVDLLGQLQTLQEQLMDIDSLDSLITLSCSMLSCSLYICDSQGFILASSPIDERSCPSFNNTVAARQVSRVHLRTMLNDKPLCNVIRDPQCVGNPCARLTFPLRIGDQALPGAITFFLWDQALTQEAQYLASMIAGAFSVFMRKRFTVTNTQQAQRISLLRELLDYKPGLRSYFERNLSLEGLLAPKSPFRLAVIPLPGRTAQQTNMLAMELQYSLPRAWAFPHKDCLLAVFNEEAMTAEDAAAPILDLLAAQGAYCCVGPAFSNLLDLRQQFEDTLAACRIAARKEPDTALHRAERWLDLVFLHRCQQYFALDQYYLEGFRKLHDFDDEAGRGYLVTLRAYLDNNMNINAAAKSIFMHRNTMSQQLDKIEELLGLPVRDPQMCWYLQLCLRIHDLLDL
ncbi:MAG: helix-turn-helix domain-containing protein [Clostridia bacterium]|nr:helix-turn-helix domain-containing protein [Clostridia bacterium]